MLSLFSLTVGEEKGLGMSLWFSMYTLLLYMMLCLNICQARTQGGFGGFERTPRSTKSVRWSNITLGLAAILYTCQEMQYTDTLQTHAYQIVQQLEVQLEGGDVRY